MSDDLGDFHLDRQAVRDWASFLTGLTISIRSELEGNEVPTRVVAQRCNEALDAAANMVGWCSLITADDAAALTHTAVNYPRQPPER